MPTMCQTRFGARESVGTWLPLLLARTQSHGENLRKQYKAHAPELLCPRGKGAGVFIFQFLSVVG